MVRIVGIAGSLRSKSLNRALLQAASALVPDNAEIQIGSFEGFPIYNGDLEEREGVPQPVEALKDKIAKADGLLIVSPEYNNGVPGPLKNAIDWLSRPPKDISRVFGGKPVGLIGATPGRGGTRFAQQAWLQTFRALGMLPWFDGSLYLAGAHESFDDNMELTDEKARELLGKYVGGFVEFVGAKG